MKVHGKWLWSSIFYLRRKSEYFIYLSRFDEAIREILIDQPQLCPDKKWGDYLAYCKACIEIINSTGYPVEFLDMLFAIYKRYLKKK